MIQHRLKQLALVMYVTIAVIILAISSKMLLGLSRTNSGILMSERKVDRCQYVVVLLLTHYIVPEQLIIFQREKIYEESDTQQSNEWKSLGSPFSASKIHFLSNISMKEARVVGISNPSKYNLMPGIPTNSTVEIFGVTVFHQLHCLVRLNESQVESDLTC